MKSIDHQVVIVGGGAGGLELAARLGRKFGPRHVVLIDRSDAHIWKPSLHEVAAGTLDIHREGLSYFMLAKDCGFTFVLGEVEAVDSKARQVQIKPVYADTGEEIFSSRTLPYHTLVMSVGSKSNFFGTPGAAEHAIALDSTAEAERFRLKLLHLLVAANRRKADDPSLQLNIGIVGGGATGVELAAELLEALDDAVFYGLNQLDPKRDIRIVLLEGADRILSALPPKMSAAAQRLLEDRGVTVRTSVRVAAVGEHELTDAEGRSYPVDLCVWAAGIKAPAWLRDLGLETNRVNQLVVDRYLRTTDPDIYAIGDCAQAPWQGQEGALPARAQVAHQQVGYLIDVLDARIRGAEDRPAKGFRFRDYGSLVSVGHSRGVGSLMGVLSGKSWFVEGLLARWMYMSLHLMHHFAVLGPVRTATLAIGRLLTKRGAPRVKLH
ncbi:NAD(P)/FAD-dependent oxidoreductase [Pollutimonas thiosulfatoxidans]|uniref:FAD-dependent oxidoreductase n=1 Tax=Pollutimonas thiosulfatoxidans TaxID=2028345 RepID=A0A410GAV5_9BURK|nr:NAD(P)/FAD-dependent oxidoreductase [Pollutimonas thiosulfatoxidans]NYT45989.1 NAD(P)/FAD-dependent oxidoreductase [Alcaligenaceae bacterium]QAA93428.1 FAD-dependent oxidoreductase [Pollutimonas thiosulfatoxidans]